MTGLPPAQGQAGGDCGEAGGGEAGGGREAAGCAAEGDRGRRRRQGRQAAAQGGRPKIQVRRISKLTMQVYLGLRVLGVGVKGLQSIAPEADAADRAVKQQRREADQKYRCDG